MRSTNPDHAPNVRSRDELLAAILRDGRNRKRGRRRIVVGMAVAAIGVSLTAGTLAWEDNKGVVEVATEGAPSTGVGSSTMIKGRTDATRSSTNEPTTPIPPTAATTPASSAPSTSTSTVCRNSDDPACGPFRWNPSPGPNAPLEVEASVTLRDDGRTVVLRALLRDNDAEITTGCTFVSWGDGEVFYSPQGCALSSCLAAYGPWAPPPRRASTLPLVLEHSFRTPGHYEIEVSGRSAAGECHNPYASKGETLVAV